MHTGFVIPTESRDKELAGPQESPITKHWFAIGTKKGSLSVVDWMSVFHQNSHEEALIPTVPVFENRACEKMKKVNWGKGLALIQEG